MPPEVAANPGPLISDPQMPPSGVPLGGEHPGRTVEPWVTSKVNSAGGIGAPVAVDTARAAAIGMSCPQGWIRDHQLAFIVICLLRRESTRTRGSRAFI